jgi:hypothetical protein
MSLRSQGAAHFVLILAIGLAGCGGGNNSKNNPTGPSSGGSAAGTWTGTLTRPGGLAPMSVRWQASVQGDSTLTGPMTLTNGIGTSVTVTANGNTAGNDKSGYSIHMQLTSNPGDISAFPNCSVRGNTAGGGQGDPFPQPYNAISVPAVDVSYSGCAGFVEYPAQSNFLQETARLTLNK